jgi:hypothetical protein
MTRTTVIAGSCCAAAEASSFCTYSGWATCWTVMSMPFSLVYCSASRVISSPSGPVSGDHISTRWPWAVCGHSPAVP